MQKVFHESAKLHVTGKAVYIDDILTNHQLLSGYIYASPHAHAKIINFDLTDAKKVKGVHAILSYKDISGINNMGPLVHDEPALVSDKIECIGQAIFLIAAENEGAALEAKKKIQIQYEILEPILTLEDAIKNGVLLQAQRKIETGNITEGFKISTHIIEGELHTGAQEHWYLETQAALCIPNEANDVKVYASTQNPTETQLLVAEVLGISANEVEVETRRLGGGFGGKETQGSHVAVWASLLAKATGKPVKVRLLRDEDQKMTGKRHPFLIKYKAGFTNEGLIQAVDVELHANGGFANDLTMAILERAMLHAENSYYIPNMRIIGKAWKTNLMSNTAFRGFGGPQGKAGIETIIDQIARVLQKDSAEIRFLNFYGTTNRNITPYQQVVKNNKLQIIWEQIIESSAYKKRKEEIDNYNKSNEFYKKGIALTPVKFGISFTTSFLNQAGALVNIYLDGSVLVNHGGTEMGQGLNTKIQQIAAIEFGIDLEKVKVNATNTSKVPNTSPTAASSGTDMNGMAVKDAIGKLKHRITKVIINEFNKKNPEKSSIAENIVFKDNFIIDTKYPDRKIAFKEAIPIIRINRESLSATGYYRTPDVYFDRQTGIGNPFYYFAFGMAVTEILLDTLTGYVKLLRTDILHDVGDSINPNIDIGQIEGAYIQGIGWVTTEECKWDTKGNLLNYSPDTYKIPSIQDIPDDFRVSLLQGAPNPNTIHRSKAVGEPPFMLALSCWMAIKYAISSIGNHKIEPNFSLPATNEMILLSIENIKKFL